MSDDDRRLAELLGARLILIDFGSMPPARPMERLSRDFEEGRTPYQLAALRQLSLERLTEMLSLDDEALWQAAVDLSEERR